ncbi:carbohydrate binding family 9 domain-containing protein [Undibacterium fentianense]|uniref:Carbohydrate binding family 9 domain-containing protein n=1 Tax=Undibacterium fentianense TaxID=2828728 RepID=A0A941E4N3_9BURK|nr:carbohydrate binding family 9 domain-containing protein [Undibacterium fentianense]MBR7801471.1 carbohydrate binding family 9 domain-containing protein [Undibacterium fentianense]
MKVFLLVFLSFVFASSTAQAGFQAHRLQAGEHIKLDGKLDETAWLKANVHDEFFQTQPFDSVLAHLRTEVRVAYDDRYLYVGIKAYDSVPNDIRDSFARRDKISIDQDFFALYIDPSSGHKSAQVFYVNARGAVMDGIYSDTSGDDTAPDYDFNVSVSRLDDGWSAEYKIPFASIAYDKHSTTPWSLLVLRNMTREQRYRMYSGAVTRATSCNLCFSHPIEGMQDLPSGMNWNVTPQLVVRRARDEVKDKPAASNGSSDLSLDLKFRPSSAVTIDATLNPDFSQIELDSPQLSGNTRFGIFVQEKRPFFLEGADIFRTPLNAISTRSIANPDVGLRYTQRDADKDFSILTSRDAAGALVLVPHTYYTGYANSTSASIATDARANFRLGSLSLGGVLTDREYAGGLGYNRVLGPDFVWQIDKNQLMRGQFLFSSGNAQVAPNGDIAKGQNSNGHAAYFDWSRGDNEWGMSVNLRDFSKDFRADNGFFSQVGFRSVNSDLTKKFGRNGALHEVNVYLSTEYKVDSDGNVLSKIVAPGIRVAGPYDSSAYLNVSPSVRSRVNQNGELFTIGRIATGFAASPGKQVARMAFDMTIGDVIDILANRLGRGGSYSLSAKLRPLDRLEIEPSFATNWINRDLSSLGSERAYTETAFQMNSIVHLSAKDTLRLILQNARTTRDAGAYASKVAPESSRQVSSMVYTHLAGVGSAIYLGWTRNQSDAPGYSAKRRQSELFTKFSWQM